MQHSSELFTPWVFVIDCMGSGFQLELCEDQVGRTISKTGPVVWNVKWRDIRPSMVTHTRNSCSAFNPSAHTSRAVDSHLCCGARGAVGGSKPCSRAPQSWYWRWRECCTFTPPIYNSAETRTRNLWIMRPNEGGLVGYCMMIEITQMALSNYLNKLRQHWFIKHHGWNNPDLQDSLKRWNVSKHQTRAESVLKLLTRPGDVLWMALRIWDG